MNTVFSGLNSEVFADWWREDINPQAPASLISASNFLQAIAKESHELTTTRWVWLYRAPWNAIALTNYIDIGEELERWLLQHKQLLNIYHHNPAAITIVNIDTLDSTLFKPAYVTPINATLTNSEVAVGGTIISSIFANLAPHYWDVFEALEAINWRPNGDPIFRHSTPAISEGELVQFLEIIRSANRIQVVEQALANEQQAHLNFQKQLSCEKAARYQAESDLAAARELFFDQQSAYELDRNLNRAQLECAQLELKAHYEKSVNYNSLIDSSNGIMHRAYLLLEDKAKNA